MGKRSYGQYCTVARALDVIGERWTLLLVRELLTGPKRFKDLLAGLPGIGTNLLTGRLKALEEDGIVRRTVLPPPAGSRVYELTDLGRSLEPVIVELSRWGAGLLGAPRGEEDLRPAWAAVALRSVFDAEAASAPKETYEFRIDGEVFHVRIEGGGVEARQGPADDPDLVVVGATEAFLAVAAGRMRPEEAVEAGSIRASESRDDDALVRCLEMLQPVASGSG
ncbi:MAG: winged helix-turn-helix transcriptional regulator [Actinomycetota bacterium]|nr:winged helix-turn-helix transcriptional regulator [Actinomycetota bacterium]MDP9479847.1 winged helix-turn-helix transcriptional regulator [Actinomycetota bacterium]